MEKEIADKILNETEAGYDLIAEKFSQTRKHFWRGLEWIGDYAQDGDKILDFGCGNGRLLELIGGKKIEYTGVDVSEKLIEIAKEKYPGENIKFEKIPSQSTLALPGDYFNTIYSIAVFHHLPSQELRSEIAKELFRVTKSEGKIIITAWNLWQKKYLKNLLSNWLSKLRSKGDLDWNDCCISFTDNQGQKFNRYHHAFILRELKNIFQGAGFEIEQCRKAGGRNLVLVGRKLPIGGNVVK